MINIGDVVYITPPVGYSTITDHWIAWLLENGPHNWCVVNRRGHGFLLLKKTTNAQFVSILENQVRVDDRF